MWIDFYHLLEERARWDDDDVAIDDDLELLVRLSFKRYTGGGGGGGWWLWAKCIGNVGANAEQPNECINEDDWFPFVVGIDK